MRDIVAPYGALATASLVPLESRGTDSAEAEPTRTLRQSAEHCVEAHDPRFRPRGVASQVDASLRVREGTCHLCSIYIKYPLRGANCTVRSDIQRTSV